MKDSRTNMTASEVYELFDRLDGRIEKSIGRLEKKIDEHYVRKHEFKPVKLIVYGAVAVILGSFMTAVVADVIRAFI